MHMFLPYTESWLHAYLQTLILHITQPLHPHLSSKSTWASFFLLRVFPSHVFTNLNATSRPKLQAPLILPTHFTFSSHICLPVHMTFGYSVVSPNSHAQATKTPKNGCVHEGNRPMLAWTLGISKSCTHF